MKTTPIQLFLISLLAVIFTVGLTFVSVELPRLTDTWLQKAFHFPDVGTVDNNNEQRDPLNESSVKTKLYMDHYHLRIIGYACLVLIVLLIAAGYITGKAGWSSAGALLLFLPVFGQFALTMFFLGGLGFFRVLWLPFIEWSHKLFMLGDIIKAPYRLILWIFNRFDIYVGKVLPKIFIGLGLLIFTLGTIAWFYAKIKKKTVADFWIYRISRHPQYLGWILWSYGIIFLAGPRIRQMFYYSNGLPWLLATMVIIGVAMLEELRMQRIYGSTYQSYREKTPFLLPGPRFLSDVIAAPMRLITRKRFPGKKWEVAATILLYILLLVGSSWIYNAVPGWIKGSERAYRIEETGLSIDALKQKVIEGAGSREWYSNTMALAALGDEALETLGELAGYDHEKIREYTVHALGEMDSKGAFELLVEAAADSSWRVRRNAMAALRKKHLHRSVDLFIQGLEDENSSVRYFAGEALGMAGSEKGIEPLKDAVYKYDGFETRMHVIALAHIPSEAVIEPLIETLTHKQAEVRRMAVLGLRQWKTESVKNALTSVLEDDDWEVRMYAMEALKNWMN